MIYQCGKCNSNTEEGFLLEKGDAGVLSPGNWVRGKPEKSLLHGVSLKGRALYEITTFRCTSCGYLESYALRQQ